MSGGVCALLCICICICVCACAGAGLHTGRRLLLLRVCGVCLHVCLLLLYVCVAPHTSHTSQDLSAEGGAVQHLATGLIRPHVYPVSEVDHEACTEPLEGLAAHLYVYMGLNKV
jgi:hypothetical protein